MEALKSLFADKLVEDHRQPLSVIQLPGIDGEFAIYPPCLTFWNQLIAVR